MKKKIRISGKGKRFFFHFEDEVQIEELVERVGKEIFGGGRKK